MWRRGVRTLGVRSSVSTTPRSGFAALSPADLTRNGPTERQLALLELITCESDRELQSKWQACAEWIRAEETPAEQVRLLPALGARLAAARVDGLQADRLKVCARHAQVSSLLQRRVLAEVGRLFLRHDIPLMALKGAATSLLCPAGPPKPMADVDGLVPTESAARAFTLLKREGWVPDQNPDADTPSTLSAGHGWGFRRGDAQFDLHWHAVHQDPTSRFDQLLREGSRSVDVDGVPIELPSATGLLLQVCIHGVRWTHGGISSWPLDVVRIVQNAALDVDWEALFVASVERRLILQVRSALGMLQPIVAHPEVDRVLARLALEPVPPVEVVEHRGITGDPRLTLPFERAACKDMVRRRREHPGVVPPTFRWRPR